MLYEMEKMGRDVYLPTVISAALKFGVMFKASAELTSVKL